MDLIEKYQELYGSPFLVGIFMGVNAIQDVALYIDGPDCIFYKSDLLYKTHDLFSDLKTSNNNTKLYFSGVMPNKMVTGYDEDIEKKLINISRNDFFKLGFITCMPVTGLLATQYENIYRNLEKDFINIPSYTDKFHLDGYNVFLREIAKYLDLDDTKIKKKNSITLLGYLFDRHEGDCLGNIKEIKRILKNIGVEVNCIWLDGGKFDDLKNIEESELIVILPYGKHAGKVLKRKLSTPQIELEVPFGIKSTKDFVLKIAQELGIDDKNVSDYINLELGNIFSKVNMLDEQYFINKNIVYAGDEFLSNQIKDICDFLGLNLVNDFNYNGISILNNEIENINNLDLLISNSDFKKLLESRNINLEIPFIEFGYPSNNTHFLNDFPYMGFKGLLNFIQNIYNKLPKELGKK